MKLVSAGLILTCIPETLIATALPSSGSAERRLPVGWLDGYGCRAKWPIPLYFTGCKFYVVRPVSSSVSFAIR